MSQFFHFVHQRKMSHFDLKNSITDNKNLTQIFRSKWLNFFAQCTMRKNESFWHKNLGQILVPPVIQFFLGQNDSFFSQLSEKIESFWPKNLGQIFVLSVIEFFRSKWLIFLWWSEKIETFWPKNLGQILVPPVSHFDQSLTTKIWPKFLYPKLSCT